MAIENARFTVLYHVTLVYNAYEIELKGVDPKKSTGKWMASWWVTAAKIDWALAHVSAKKKVPTSELVIFRKIVTESYVKENFKAFGVPGVYRTEYRLKCDGYEHANLYFERIAKEGVEEND